MNFFFTCQKPGIFMTQFSKIRLSIDKLAANCWKKSANRKSLKPVFKQHDRSLNQHTFPSYLGIPIHFFTFSLLYLFSNRGDPKVASNFVELFFLRGPGLLNLVAGLLSSVIKGFSNHRSTDISAENLYVFCSDVIEAIAAV